jgi:hypothetical protein
VLTLQPEDRKNIIMKTEMQTLELVAIEEASLELVAGGGGADLDISKTVSLALDVDVDLNKQSNDIDFSHNDIYAYGPAIFQFTQQNVNGGKAV